MKKVFNILGNVFLILGVVLVGVCGLVAVLPDPDAFVSSCNRIMIQVLYGAMIPVMVGIFLTFTKNKISRNIGQGLLLAGMVIVGLASVAIMATEAPVSPEGIVPTVLSPIVGLIGVVFYAIAYLIRFILLVIDRTNKDNGVLIDDPRQDPKFVTVRAWRSLMEEGIISEEEYNAKRMEVLNIKKDDKKPEVK